MLNGLKKIIIYETYVFLFLYVGAYVSEITGAHIIHGLTILFSIPVMIIWFFTMKVTLAYMENDLYRNKE